MDSFSESEIYNVEKGERILKIFWAAIKYQILFIGIENEVCDECAIFMGREGEYPDFNFYQMNLYVKSDSNQNYQRRGLCVCVCVCACVPAHTPAA